MEVSSRQINRFIHVTLSRSLYLLCYVRSISLSALLELVLFQGTIPFTSSSNLNNAVNFTTLATDNGGENVMAISVVDGMYQVYFAQDYGFTWSIAPLPTVINGYTSVWGSIALNGNGESFYAATSKYVGYLYTATNPASAASWTPLTSLSSIGPCSGINDIAVSYSGQTIFVSGPFQIIYVDRPPSYVYGAISTDGGNSFTLLTWITTSCSYIAIDNSGTSIVCAQEYDTTNIILVSSNSGASFTTTTVFSGQYYDAHGFAASYYNYNQYMYMPSQSDSTYLLVSTDYGQVWNPQTIISDTESVVSNDISVTGNGNTVYLATTTALYYSTNSGQTWYKGYNGGVTAVVVCESGANVYISTSLNGFLAYRNNSMLSPSPSYPPTMSPTIIQWSEISLPTTTNGYNHVIMSADANYIVASQIGGQLVGYTRSTNQIQVSSDVTGHAWTDICMNYDGSYVLAIGDEFPYYLATSYSMSSLTKATVSTNADIQTDLSINFCAMTSSGNVTVISQLETDTNSLTNSWVIAIYKKTLSTTPYQPTFTPVTASQTYNGFTNVGIDETGQVIAVMFTANGGLWLTTDGGTTWRKRNTASFYSTYLTMSQYGLGNAIVTAYSSAFDQEYSTNQGVTWTLIPSIGELTETIYSISSSYSGQIVAAATNDGIYISTNYGQTWTLQYAYSYSYNNALTIDVTIDPTGQYYAFVGTGSSTLYLLNSYSSAYPTVTPTRTPTYDPSNTIPPSASPTTAPASLQFVPAGNLNGGIYHLVTDYLGKTIMGVAQSSDEVVVSQDYGFLFAPSSLPYTINNVLITWEYLAMSGNGLNLYAGSSGGSNYLYGCTNCTDPSKPSAWAPLTSYVGTQMYGIATDDSGQYLFISGYFLYAGTDGKTGYCYGGFSNDYGQTITLLSNLTVLCLDIAIDSTGSNLACAVINSPEAGTTSMYISNNYGRTWKRYLATPSFSFYIAAALATSKYNGNQYMYMPSSSQTIHYTMMSSSYGHTWNKSYFLSNDTAFNAIPSCASSSGYGQSVFICTNFGLYYSLNSGQVWQRGYSGDIVSAATSGNGANVYFSSEAAFFASRNDTSLTGTPTGLPSLAPSQLPSRTPTEAPSQDPTLSPSNMPSLSPTCTPSIVPTTAPSMYPTTQLPSAMPTPIPTAAPSIQPSIISFPSLLPSMIPSTSPSNVPTTSPTASPSCVPSITPTAFVTTNDVTSAPTTSSAIPSCTPTVIPTQMPSVDGPTLVPTILSMMPTISPSLISTDSPQTTNCPTILRTSTPSLLPSLAPSSESGTSSSSSSSSGSQLSGGGIAGVTIAVIVFAIISAVVCYYRTLCSGQKGKLNNSFEPTSRPGTIHFANNPLNATLIDENL